MEELTFKERIPMEINDDREFCLKISVATFRSSLISLTGITSFKGRWASIITQGIMLPRLKSIN